MVKNTGHSETCLEFVFVTSPHCSTCLENIVTVTKQSPKCLEYFRTVMHLCCSYLRRFISELNAVNQSILSPWCPGQYKEGLVCVNVCVHASSACRFMYMLLYSYSAVTIVYAV